MADLPISKDSPHNRFDPDSPGWIHRRVEQNKGVLAEDVARILEKNPELLPDEIIRSQAIRGLRRELKARRGPKPMSAVMAWRILARYEVLVDEHYKGQRPVRRGGYAPAARGLSTMERIHEIIAKEFSLGGKENVRNLISSFKKNGNRVSSKRAKG